MNRYSPLGVENAVHSLELYFSVQQTPLVSFVRFEFVAPFSLALFHHSFPVAP